MEVQWDPSSNTGRRVLVPRTEGMGLMIRAADLHGVGIFAIADLTGIYCTDEVRDAVLRATLTNIDFLEMGDLT